METAKTSMDRCPRQESNLRTRFRKPLLYPLSYGGSDAITIADPEREEAHGSHAPRGQGRRADARAYRRILILRDTTARPSTYHTNLVTGRIPFAHTSNVSLSPFSHDQPTTMRPAQRRPFFSVQHTR
jgi:hypothetical protein